MPDAMISFTWTEVFRYLLEAAARHNLLPEDLVGVPLDFSGKVNKEGVTVEVTKQ